MNTDEKRNPRSPSDRSIRRHLALGLGVAMLLMAGGGGWALTAGIAGAVLGHGTVVVDGHVKSIQHRDGGIVGKIMVRDGDRVADGDLLILLDDTLPRANLAIVEKQIDQLTLRRVRLTAERDERAEIAIPAPLSHRMAEPEFIRMVATEKSLFKARRQTIIGQREQLGKRVLQIEKEVEGLRALLEVKKEECLLRDQELEGGNSLYEQGFISFFQYGEIRRLKVQAHGERERLAAEIAGAMSRIAETELQVLQLEQDRRAEILAALQEADNLLSELVEQRVALRDQLARIEIRSPQDGIVHELQAHTVGGVIAAGETVMRIVPAREELMVEARLRPTDINHVRPGQETILRFSAFNHRTTPELTGTVRTVAADLSRDPVSGDGWYTARISIAAEQMARLGGLPLVPGMPVEAFVQTGSRTAFSYLLKPLADQLARAMREE